MSTATPIVPQVDYIKDVRRNNETRDWDAYLVIDGVEQYLGSRKTSWQAEALCDATVRDLLSSPTPLPEPTAAELGQRLAAARADVLADEDVQIIHLDIRTEAERRYDALKDGSAYVQQPEPATALADQFAAVFSDPSLTMDEIGRRCAAITIAATPKRSGPQSGDELPFGQLSDGTPITGVYDKDEPGGRSGLVHARIGHMLLSAQEDPSLFSITNQRLHDMSIDEVNTLRGILSTDIPEQLLAAAIAPSARGCQLSTCAARHTCHPG